MHPNTIAFLDILFERCSPLRSSVNLTFTAIYPDGKFATPSHHVPLNNRAGMLDTLQRLSATNRMGWGAYFAVGLRKLGLSRWRRGSVAEVVALPAFYTDIDDPTDVVLAKLRSALLPPSIIVGSGGGYHAYWLLEKPTIDLSTARQVLQGLARTFGGDGLSTAQSLRLPGTINTKPERGKAVCHLVEISDLHYHLSDFQSFILPIPPPLVREPTLQVFNHTGSRTLNSELIRAITTLLYRTYAARERQQSEWIAALCPCGHARDSPGTHFFWNPTIGCGHCHGRHGTLRLIELCSILGINAAAYGGIYR
ncbi:MAG: RepB family DNA primase [Chloroflexi bacterium]|nr:RepB family DNA primase [Chloroflexota bacterium]